MLTSPWACTPPLPWYLSRSAIVTSSPHGVQGPGRPSLYEGSWIQLLNVSGFAVCGIDSQSCGFSEVVSGLRNYFESFDDLVADVVQFRR